MMIWKSVIGEVSSSSIVPDRFSSEYVRIVIIGSDEQEHDHRVPEHRPNELFVDVHRRRSGAQARHLHALTFEEAYRRVEVVAVDQGIQADHDVGDRRREVALELLVGNREDVIHVHLRRRVLRRLFPRWSD